MATKKKTETKPKTTEAEVTKEEVVVQETPITLFEFIKQQKEKQK